MYSRFAVLSAATAAAIAFSIPSAPQVGATGADPVAAPEWTYSPDEPIAPGDIRARSIGESISLDEAERRLRADGAASVLAREARTRWPATFAGVWIDHAPYRVNVAFTQGADENVADLAQRFPYPADLRAVTASVTLDALHSLQDTLGQERLLLRRGRRPANAGPALRETRGRYDLDIDVPHGTVVVRVARPTPELRREMDRRFGRGVVVEHGLAQPRACSITSCTFAMMGGLRLQLFAPTTTHYCSSAFTAFNTTYQSTRYVLSAGHCTRDTGITSRSHAGAMYGSVTKYDVTQTDAERIANTSDGLWREAGKFFVAGEYPRSVSSVTPFSAMEIGAYIGKTGERTGTTRGYITSKNASPAYIPNATQFVTASMCSDKGDSGGAVWKSTSAYGIVSGGPHANCRDENGVVRAPRTPTEGPTWFAAVSYVTTVLNVTLLSGANLSPVADFTYSCTLNSCSFDGRASADEDGGIAWWTWDFGDGMTASANFGTHSHTFVAPGVYTVTLTVKDNNGATSTHSRTVTVSQP